MTYQTIYPVIDRDNQCLFRTWAPHAGAVSLVIFPGEKAVPMERKEHGYWEKMLHEIEPGTRYKYKIDGGDPLPDPASLSQPDGVHGSSEIIRLDDFKWTDGQWDNIPLTDMILYELHTGTFSQDGNFDGVCKRLDYLKDLGINTIEIMPVAQFSG
ncbi:MAG TPA: malto-oligosyltrehalose trehalohydrolase, partial [Bacteroides sp.]|nr:malto-oligosyltrehalose trehalohydrolase [Bacteroides sp.]